uniref:arylamine N-acetyltransferase n=1 Tax=Erpetoichthys calabaricus TaxID=27687 RepID=A0A8C4RT68_ERPCA
MDVGLYLRRIQFPGKPEATLEDLQKLSRQHLFTVPFENLTIHSGGRIHLNLGWVYHKIVIQHRGGFCYENNSLFGWLLSQLGFNITHLAAQVKNNITKYFGPPFGHLITMVNLGGHRWLCDVGFGAYFQSPLSLETESNQTQPNGVYRVKQEGEDISTVHSRSEWEQLYKFTLTPRSVEEFSEMCVYHQTSPSSLFYCKSLCCLHLPNGVLSYVGRRFTHVVYPSPGCKVEKEKLNGLSDEEIRKLLKERFNIVLHCPLIPKDEQISHIVFLM